MRRNWSLWPRIREKSPSFWRIIAQETIEKKRRIRRTPRATQPVWVRIPPISVRKIVVNRRRIKYSSVRASNL
jgi:hypothetical protein